MLKAFGRLVVLVALVVAIVAPGTGTAKPQPTSLWQQACQRAANGQVFPNPGPLDCINPRTEFPNFGVGALALLQHICEQALDGTFLHRSETTEHAYCFLNADASVGFDPAL